MADSNTWRNFHDEHMKLEEEENGLLKNTLEKQYLHAYNSAEMSGDDGHYQTYGDWKLSNGPNGELQERFETLETKAGIALDSPPGIRPLDFWLDSLFLFLKENKDRYPHQTIGDVNEAGIIENVCKNSATLCSWLEKTALESAASEPEAETTVQGISKTAIESPTSQEGQAPAVSPATPQSDSGQGVGQQMQSQSVGVADGSKANQHAAGEEKPRRKPGPIAKMDYHRAIAAIVEPYGDGWREESNLEKIVEELDRNKDKTPPRKSWATPNTKRVAARSWGRMVRIDANMVRKAIAPSLKMAAKDTANRNSGNSG